MTTHKHLRVLLALALATLMSTAFAQESQQQQAEPEDPPAPTVTFHLDAVSSYVLRGATTTYGNSKPGLGNGMADAPESNRVTPQWGADYVSENGLALSYWASMINYSYERLGQSYSDRSLTNLQNPRSVENDLYAGYNGTIGAVSYSLGMTGYLYINGRHANALETKATISYAGFTLGSQTLLNDVVWGNRGDTYWTLNYSHTLPYNITLSASLGAYTYHKEGKYYGTRDTFLGTQCGPGSAFVVNGCFAGNGPSSGGFRHFIVGVTQPIGHTGLVWGIQGIIGGKNRFNVSQDHTVIGSISYQFGI